MSCTHEWRRTGTQRYRYSWRCGRCAASRVNYGNDARPSPSGCSAQGGPDPGQHRWGSATQTLQHEDRCGKCAATRWR